MSMKFEVSKDYKSFKAGFTWDDIPMFAIVTGENGVGKTQLLELMADVPGWISYGKFSEDVAKDRVVHVHVTQAHLKTGNHSTAKMEEQLNGRISSRKLLELFGGDEKHDVIGQIMEKTGKTEHELTALDLYESGMWHILEEDHFFPDSVFQSLGEKFYRYYLMYQDIANQHQDFQAARDEMGEAPWDTFNQLLEEVGFPYRVTAPVSFARSYSIECHRQGDSGTRVPLEALSSGETAMLMVLAWVYGGKLTEVFPQLILLDEPDATLHSALIPHFLHHLQHTVVQNFGCRVIVTSHRLETIAAAPEGTLYELRRSPHRIEVADSHDQVAKRMTGGVFEMILATRCVFVEDEDDAHFYRDMYQAMRKVGVLDATPSLSFSPASIGKGKQRTTSGGKDSVRTHVARLREAGLGQFIRGLIDGDNEAVAPDDEGIFRIERYALENYLCDPLVLFCASIDVGHAPSIAGMDVLQPGEEPGIRELPGATLQRLADAIIEPLEREVGIGNSKRRTERFIGGQTVQYPDWLWTTQGHTLKAKAHQALEWLRLTGGNASLQKAALRLGMFPESLVQVFRDLQAS